MTKMTAREALHLAAKLAFDHAPSEGEVRSGICAMIGACVRQIDDDIELMHKVYSLLGDVITSWPEGTGSRDYPIPATSPLVSDIKPPEIAASRQFYIRRERWTGEQRKLRLALLRYIIAQTAPKED